jgi:hypothetical protein
LAVALQQGQYDDFQQPQPEPPPSAAQPEEDRGFLERVQGDQSLFDFYLANILGGPERTLTLASGAIAEPVAGLAGLGASLIPGLDPGAGARTVEGVREALTIEPFTRFGREAVRQTGEALRPLGEAVEGIQEATGGTTLEATGSPALATAAAVAPEALLEFIPFMRGVNRPRGAKGVKGISDDAIKPLEDAGVSIDDLTDDAIGQLRERTRTRAAEEQARLAEEFAEAGDLPLMTSDIFQPKGFAQKGAQRMAEQVPFLGTGRLRAAQQEVRSRLVEDYGDRFGDYNPEDVYRSLRENVSKVKQAAGKRRGEIAQEMSGFRVSDSSAVKAIDDEIDRLTRTRGTGEVREVIDQQTVGELQRFKNDILNDPTFDNLDDLRTIFRESVKGERQVLNNRSQAAINKIYNAFSRDMDFAIYSRLGPQELKRWRKANQVYASEVANIKDSRLKTALQKGEVTPEVVNNLLYSKKPSETKALYRALGSDGREAARAGLISKALETTRGSPDRFINELNKLSKNTDIVFKGADKDYLQGLKSYLEQTRRAGEAGVLTATGQQTIPWLVGFGLGADAFAGTGAAAYVAGAYGLMARAYESRRFRRIMGTLAKHKPDSKAFRDNYLEAQAWLVFESQRMQDLERQMQENDDVTGGGESVPP